jgi:Bacterial pre-peptidase C-terminal domain
MISLKITMLSTTKLDAQLSISSPLSLQNGLNPGLAPFSPLTTTTDLTDPLQSNSLVGSASAPASTTLAATALSAPLPISGGISFYTATNLGSLSSTQTIQDYLGVSTSRPDSYYRFTLNSISNLNLVMTGLTADADLRLLNSAGTVVASSLLYGYTQDETINLADLPSGEYYIRANRYSGNTGFTLNLSTNPISNLLPSEIELGNVGSGVITQTGTINNSNTSDVYHFSSMAPSSNFTLSLSGLSADADVRVIRDANHNSMVDAGEVIVRSTQLGAASETINLQGLGTGDYFIQVYQGSIGSTTGYTLSVQGTTGLGVADGINGRLEQAVNLNTLSGTRHFGGSVSTPIGNPTVNAILSGAFASSSQDTYRFTLGTTSNFSLALTGLNANADVQVIRDANNNGYVDAGEVIVTAATTGTNAEILDIQGLGAGDYFVQVYRGQDNTGLATLSTNYNLMLQATPGLGLPPSPGYVHYIGNLNAPRGFGGSISDRRTVDFYEFTLETASNLNLELGGLTGNLNVMLYQNYNNNGFIEPYEVIAESTRPGSLSEFINRQGLAAGRYFVMVYRATNDVNDYSDYVLNLQATPL